MTWLRALMLALCLVVTPALAVNPDEILPDVALEQRAREISAGLRCLVCQNQSIDDSDADNVYHEIMIRRAGFERVTFRNYTGGIAALHSGWKL